MDPLLPIAKIFWFIAEPSSLLLSIWLFGAILLWTRWFGFGRLLVAAAALITLANAMFPIGQMALKPIEDRFPPVINLPNRIDGIIVLGGVVDEEVIGRRGIPRSLVGPGSPRLDAFLELARRYPAAQHVFTGGSIQLINDRDTEADVVRRIFARLGLDVTRIVFEDQSRNTWENALFTYRLIKPAPEERWLLITSARHMPRAVGVFRKVGWSVIPFPIDFVTDEELKLSPEFGLGANMNYVSEALREWLGLVAYHLMGRTADWFPAPIPARPSG
jgi:uncharacterized SAM-binding protein YcdF (DUF218 family)